MSTETTAQFTGTATAIETIDATQTKVLSVTLLGNQRAQVTRALSIQLKDSSLVVEITNLPLLINQSSLRVTGSGARKFIVADVVYKKVPAVNPADRENKLAIQELETRMRVLQNQLNILDNFSNEFVKRPTASFSEVSELLDSLSLKRAQIEADGFKAQADLNDLIARISKMYHPKESVTVSVLLTFDNNHNGTTGSHNASNAELILEYTVVGASSWSIIYDIRAESKSDGMPDSKLIVNYRASISQNSGEDWRDCEIKLSTANGSGFGVSRIPDHVGKVIRLLSRSGVGVFGSKQAQSQAVQSNLFGNTANANTFGVPTPAGFGFGAPALGGFGQSTSNVQSTSGASFGSAPHPASTDQTNQTDQNELNSTGWNFVDDSVEADEEADGEEGKLVSFEEPTMSSSHGVASTFVIQGKSSIPSDGATHKLSITSFICPVSISWVVTAGRRCEAFMQAIITNNSDMHLYPGNASVFFDNTFISTTSVKNTPPKSKFSISLGIDPKIRILYTQNVYHHPRSAFAFAAPTDKTTITCTTRVQHPYQFPIPVIVRDVIPRSLSSESSEVKTVLCKPAGLVDGNNADEASNHAGIAKWAAGGNSKNGKLMWVNETLGGGEDMVAVLEFDVITPVDTKWEIKLDS
ncbi:hypothetical protein HK100_012128 [Physocladia obscura]|uniref:Mucoidy inhibitor A n=1 Tax=Physocladia obscura TaxID=109957 RepID=A0AAD5T1P6_9FUNG|nr:hypothetical protein HK100_012128 [Physocladia obscura]